MRILPLIFLISFTLCGKRENLLLNVSYDPTREFFHEYNALFQSHWKKMTGEDIQISQSHGGSGKQARGVIDGLPADVVTLGCSYDIDRIASRGLLPADWQQKLPNNSSPFYSTIVFVVRKGNPRNIHDWPDLVAPGVQVILPNPKTGSSARWAYLAAYGQAKKTGGKAAADEYIRKLIAAVPIMDTGARAALTTFAERRMGDVFLSWENDAYLALREHPDLQIIVPPVSIRAEPAVAVVEKNARPRLKAAQEYLSYLYSEEAQDLAGKHHYRPRSAAAAARYASMFPNLILLDLNEVSGSWAQADKEHFADGASFDQAYRKRSRP